MNDFTKEELEQIMWAIHGEFSLPKNLGNKIQSMIDNYCDHNGSIPSLIQRTIFECPKCGRDDI